jgi:hypothetical protein
MLRNPRTNDTLDCSRRIKGTGRLAIGGNAFAVFGILMFEYQTGGHGEMGSFYHDNIVWTLLFAAWGLATGIGLLRAWRWARISTLIFSGLFSAFGILGVVVFLCIPGGGVSGVELMILRTASTVAFLIPIAVGIRWLVFFARKDVKAYFQPDQERPSVVT